MDNKVNIISKALFNIVMGVIWIGFGCFWLLYNPTYKVFISVLDQHPMWTLFNIVAICYGLWRINRGYNIYKRKEF